MFQLEASKDVLFYARNDRLEFNIPYELYGNSLFYQPDFLVRLTNGMTLILEIKGQMHEETEAKHQGARRWVSAVNNWGKLGQWDFVVCRDPQRVSALIDDIATD
jgi:type III restriction enzyme